MNHPRATRLRLCLAVAVVAAFAAVTGPSVASATVTSVANGIYGPTGATTATPPVGGHTDYQIDQTFTYDTVDEDLKKWIVDSPGGLVGNPNAIPSDDRCTTAQFGALSAASTNATCPASSRVGFATLYLASDGKAGDGSASAIPAGTPMTPVQGTIYLLKTDPEIPTTLATILSTTVYQDAICTAVYGTPTTAPCTVYRRTKSTLAPVTNLSSANLGDMDFRIRTVPQDDIDPPVVYGPTGMGFPSYTIGGLAAHITRIDQHLYSHADQNPSNPPFLTSPHNSGPWDSFSYATAWDSNDGTLAADPNNPSYLFTKSAASTVTPDSSSKPALSAGATAVLSDHNRDAHPGLSVSVKNADVVNGDNPSKVVVTLPGATTVDVQNTSNACLTSQRDAGSCPDAAQVGTATISTPLISAGLTGKVYIVKNESKPSLPDLTIFVDGAVKFRLDGTTKFVGTDSAQIETTFAGLPDTPFSDFTVNINGGASGILMNRSCPTNGSAPLDGATTSVITGFTGASSTSTSANNYPPCYGTPKVSKKNNCTKVTKKFSANPSGFVDVPGIQKVQIQTSTKSKSKFHTRQTDRKTPYKFKFTLKKSKFKKNRKYYYRVRVAYNDGKVVYSKSTTFKTCK